jgi:hypothetical protein
MMPDQMPTARLASMTKAELETHRNSEFENASSAAEWHSLQERWGRENAAIRELHLRQAEMDDWRVKALSDAQARISMLEARSAKIEKIAARQTEFAEVLDAVLETLDSILNRLAQLDEQPTMSYAGIWDEDKSTYEPGSVVTAGGAAWYAVTKTSGRPGKDVSWRLIMKSTTGGDR